MYMANFKKEQGGLMRFFSILKDLDWDEKEKAMRELRDSFLRRLK